MAGSRLDRIGTIFSRATGLLRSGAVKYQDRPVWYDVYRVFPPKYEPRIDRESGKSVEDIPVILFKEDQLRASFFSKLGHNPGGEVRRLNDPNYEESSHIFIGKYQAIEKDNPEWSSEQVFDAAFEAYRISRPVVIREKKEYATRESRLSTSISMDEVADEIKFNDKPHRSRIITPESLRSLFEDALEKQKEKKEQDGTSREKNSESDK